MPAKSKVLVFRPCTYVLGPCTCLGMSSPCPWPRKLSHCPCPWAWSPC